MNKKVSILIVVIVVVVVLALAVVYAPSLTELLLRMHSIPQH